MANIKSAKKRVLVIERNKERNKSNRSALKTQIKKFNTSVEKGELDKAEKMLPKTFETIDKSTTNGAIHKNSANRKKSILSKKLNDAKLGKKTEKKVTVKAKPVEAKVEAKEEVVAKPVEKKAPAKTTATKTATAKTATKKAPAKKTTK